MKKIVWNESLSVGIEMFDNEHKMLINLINDFNSSTESNSEKITILLYKLMEYAKTHFKTEEEYMERSKYPQLIEHKNQHLEFVLSVDKLTYDFYEGKFFISYKLKNLLQKWLVNHIQKHDKMYAAHLIQVYK